MKQGRLNQPWIVGVEWDLIFPLNEPNPRSKRIGGMLTKTSLFGLKLLLLLAGFFLTSTTLGLGPSDFVRPATLRMGNPWIGSFLFYLMPFLEAYLAAFLICRIRIRVASEIHAPGVALIVGSLAASLLHFCLGWESLFYCRSYASCGNCSWGWYATTASLPAALGKLAALRSTVWRRPRTQRAGNSIVS